MSANPDHPTLGDHFMTPGNPPIEWVAVEWVQQSGLPLHVRLERLPDHRRTIVIAASELRNERRFRRLGARPARGATHRRARRRGA